MKKTTDYLISLGLTKIEAVIYEGLLQTGPTTIKDLSEFLNIKRITTHFNVEGLIERGLIIQTMNGARRRIVAENPQKINYLVEQKEKNIKQLKDDFPDFIKTLEYVSPGKPPPSMKAEVKYYEGKNSVRLVYKDIVKANEIRSYVNSIEINRIFPENFSLFSKAHEQNKQMKMWEIIKKPPEIKTYIDSMDLSRYFIKIVPKTINLSIIDNLIYDDKVAIINVKKNPTAIVITNKEYYENSKAIFDFVWEMIPTEKITY